MPNTPTLPVDAILSSEAARILGVSAQAVRMWERRGVLPAMKTAGGVRVFSQRDVEAFAEQRRRTRASRTARAEAAAR